MSSAITTHAESDKDRFQAVSDQYFDQVYFPHQPTAGTVAGYHQYDNKLEDFSQTSINAEVSDLNHFADRFAAIPADSLDQTTRGDRQMVLGKIQSRLLTLSTIRPWAKNADNYSSTCANGAFTLMERKFAPTRRSPAFPRRTRKTDARPARRGPRQPQKSAPHLH